MELITNTSLKYLRQSFIFSRFIPFHPFLWQRRTDSLELTQSRSRVFLWYIFAAVTFAYYGFIVGRCVRINSAPEATTQQKIYMQFAVVYYAFPVFFQISNIANRNYYSPMVKRALQSLRKCQGDPYLLH